MPLPVKPAVGTTKNISRPDASALADEAIADVSIADAVYAGGGRPKPGAKPKLGAA